MTPRSGSLLTPPLPRPGPARSGPSSRLPGRCCIRSRKRVVNAPVEHAVPRLAVPPRRNRAGGESCSHGGGRSVQALARVREHSASAGPWNVRAGARAADVRPGQAGRRCVLAQMPRTPEESSAASATWSGAGRFRRAGPVSSAVGHRLAQSAATMRLVADRLARARPRSSRSAAAPLRGGGLSAMRSAVTPLLCPAHRGLRRPRFRSLLIPLYCAECVPPGCRLLSRCRAPTSVGGAVSLQAGPRARRVGHGTLARRYRVRDGVPCYRLLELGSAPCREQTPSARSRRVSSAAFAQFPAVSIVATLSASGSGRPSTDEAPALASATSPVDLPDPALTTGVPRPGCCPKGKHRLSSSGTSNRRGLAPP